jgi:hypothetical protein
MPSDDGKMDVVQFAEAVKSKHPEYKDVPNLVLTSKMLQKYPEYKNKIKSAPDVKGAPSAGDYVKSVASGLGTAAKNVAMFPIQAASSPTEAERERFKADPTSNVPDPNKTGGIITNMANHLIRQPIRQLEEATAARNKVKEQGEGWAGQTLTTLENYPLIGEMVKSLEKQGPGTGPAWAPGTLTPDAIKTVSEAAGYAIVPEVAGRVTKAAKPIIGKAARDYAGKTATKLTDTTGAPGLIREKDTGINVPDRIAEMTKLKDVTGLKHSADVYDAKASAATKQVEDLAVEMNNRGIKVEGPAAQALSKRVGLIFQKSKQIRDMVEFGQTRFANWGKNPSEFTAVDILAMKRDLDELVNYEGGEKKTPLAREARQLRNEIDKSFDKVAPGWQDANERAYATIKAKEALETRHNNSLRDIVKETTHRLIGSTMEKATGAAELSGIWLGLHQAGVHGYPAYLAATVGLGIARGIYQSVPSQMFRIAFSDAIADALTGKRAPKGPAGWPGMSGAAPAGAGGTGPQGPSGAPQLTPEQQQQAHTDMDNIVKQAALKAASQAGIPESKILKLLGPASN